MLSFSEGSGEIASPAPLVAQTNLHIQWEGAVYLEDRLRAGRRDCLEDRQTGYAGRKETEPN